MDELVSVFVDDEVVDDVPVSAALKVVSGFDELLEEDCEDVIEWCEVQRLVFEADFEPLLLAFPHVVRPSFDWRQFEDIDGRLVDVSAFATRDFLDGKAGLDRFKYASSKVAERVKGLAIVYSCVSDADGKQNVYKRFLALVQASYGDRVAVLAERFGRCFDEVRRSGIKARVAKLNREILRLKSVWERFSVWP